MSWQDNFRDATTNVAFNLQLSKRMVEAMKIAYYYDQRMHWDCSFPHWIASVRAVKERGLVEHHDKDVNYSSWDYKQRAEYDKQFRHYTLTPAGKAVCNLLILAGLIQQPLLELEDAA